MSQQKEKPKPRPASDEQQEGDKKKDDYIDKTLSTTANLVKLLPTGTTLAFQALSPSFTNHGKCLPINRYISGGLVAFCCGICALLSFTDSIVDKKGRPYYGIALPLDDYGDGGFLPFNYEKDFDREELAKRRLRPRDFLHATLRVFVFLAVAFSDAGIQTCLFPMESQSWREALVNMPLGVGFIASFVFMIFPSTRKGVGYGAEAPIDADSGQNKDGDKKDDNKQDDDTTISNKNDGDSAK
uniref:DUF679 domain membrane protein 2 n=1 Tax=Oryza brachyantha TaxID=4533 RepID=J3KZX4_ORYBR